jgi:hypothetical protein
VQAGPAAHIRFPQVKAFSELASQQLLTKAELSIQLRALGANADYLDLIAADVVGVLQGLLLTFPEGDARVSLLPEKSWERSSSDRGSQSSLTLHFSIQGEMATA